MHSTLGKFAATHNVTSIALMEVNVHKHLILQEHNVLYYVYSFLVPAEGECAEPTESYEAVSGQLDSVVLGSNMVERVTDNWMPLEMFPEAVPCPALTLLTIPSHPFNCKDCMFPGSIFLCKKCSEDYNAS